MGGVKMNFLEFKKQLDKYRDENLDDPSYVIMSFYTLTLLCEEIDKSMNCRHTKETLEIMCRIGFTPKHQQSDPSKVVGIYHCKVQINNNIQLGTLEFSKLKPQITK